MLVLIPKLKLQISILFARIYYNVRKIFGCNIPLEIIVLSRKQPIIGGLQLRHSFFPPKRLDVKTPLQSIGRYRKSMYNSLSGHT